MYEKHKTLADIKMSKSLNELVKKPVNRISLHTFENKFLSIIALDKNDKDKVNAILADMSRKTGVDHGVDDIIGNLLGEWSDEVGDIKCYTECIDGQGNIVYIIPPFLDMDSDLSDYGSQFSRLVEMADAQTVAHPKLGEKFIKENIIPLIKPSTKNEDWIKQWNIIFKYHDLSLLKISGSDDDIVDTQEEKNVVSDFDNFY